MIAIEIIQIYWKRISKNKNQDARHKIQLEECIAHGALDHVCVSLLSVS